VAKTKRAPPWALARDESSYAALGLPLVALHCFVIGAWMAAVTNDLRRMCARQSGPDEKECFWSAICVAGASRSYASDFDKEAAPLLFLKSL